MKKIAIGIFALAALTSMPTFAKIDGAVQYPNKHMSPGFIHQFNSCTDHFSFNKKLGVNGIEESMQNSIIKNGNSGVQLKRSDNDLFIKIDDLKPRAIVYRGVTSDNKINEYVGVINPNVQSYFKVPISSEQVTIALYQECAFVN